MTEPVPPAVEWVTKTNMTDLVRCPRTFWLIANGVITHDESLAPADRVIVNEGVAFEEAIIETAVDGELAGVDAADFSWFLKVQTDLFVNEGRGLRGEPDGIETDSGSWAPLEIKSHRHATALDRLELAFYWLLLEGHREGDREPHGYLILKGDHGPAEPRRIELEKRHLTEVLRLVEEVRRLRTLNEPFGCGQCYVCRESHPLWSAAYLAQIEDGYLGRLYDMGSTRMRNLSQVGIYSCDDLLTFGVEDVLDRIKGRRYSFGRYQVTGWVAHARAFAENRPIVFGTPAPMPSECITFDLEYHRGGPIWLAGMLAGDDLTQIWRWPEEDEKLLMSQVVAYWADHSNAQILTWWGTGADFPILRAASERTGVQFKPEPETHFDLFYWAMRHLRLPIQGLSLKDVVAYFDLPRSESGIGSGDDAVGVYLTAAAKGSRARKTARARLERYNHDDLRGAVALVEVLRTMYPQVPLPAVPPPVTRKAARSLSDPVRISARVFAVDERDRRGWDELNSLR